MLDDPAPVVDERDPLARRVDDHGEIGANGTNELASALGARVHIERRLTDDLVDHLGPGRDDLDAEGAQH